jgi:hypothetical protein
MPVYHRTQRLQIFGEKPEIQKLYGSRYRMVVRCVAKNDTKAWYDDNKAQIFADFGSLYSAQMSVDGIDARTGEAYDDMVLVKNEATYTRSGEYVIVFTYETLTDSFVQETEDKVDFDLNGLKRLTRTIIAKDTVAYSSVVGTTTILGSSPLLTLAQVSEDQLEASEDGFKRIQEVWLESGTLSETLDNVGSQKAKVIETIGADPATPSGYSLASKQESDFEGFQTNRFTFLKDNVILSESEDEVGSQNSIVQEVFNGTPATPSGYSLANKQESDVDGIPTKRYTFLKENVELSRSEDKVGSQLAITTEIFKPSADPVEAGYSVARTEVSDVDGIPTKRFTFLKNNVVLSVSEDKVGSQKAVVNEVFNPTSEAITGINTSGNALVGYSEANRTESDYEGIKTIRVQFLKNNVVLSRSIQTKSGGNLILEVVEVFNGTPVAETTGAVKIGDEVSDVDGIPTRKFTFAKGDGQILVESRPAPAQLAGCTYVTVRSLGTEVTPTGVLVAESETESDGYITYEKTALQGTITGTKQTYKDVVDVTVAGVVNCTSVSKTAGGISGTIAVTQVTPPRTKTLAATVTVEVTTSPPDTVSLAYDLGDISCSVTSISMSENFRGTDVFTTKSGNTRFSGQRKAADMSARISTYPNCYLSNSTGEGTFSYTSSYENASTSPNSINPSAQTSTTKTFTDGTGSTSASYNTTGVVERNSRPILTDLSGTTYYEVITWTV